ncbi:PC4/YdbC family ssDNA-binding protein [Piscinibacter koreensis]|uniref:Transcriptional coactivator p15 (PC4) C-terminal domain-containing protein n=1 Tax=Piscinibacter koreensis TaxID=2742824 RepID=A0A7Y6NQV1_9BURK|nr:PC4/YdbC family ssDNA-binding protein [Schlegelella koreensis]NUZ07658.1 hypothetical protein [Schlegelella koreensis]
MADEAARRGLASPERLAQLRERRNALAADRDALAGLPEAGRRKDWARTLRDMDGLLQQLDALIDRGNRAPKAARPARAARRDEPKDVVTIARLPKGEGGEVRVRVLTWRGERVVDVRLWVTCDGGEPAPTRRGVAVAAGDLGGLLDALRSAAAHV